MKYRSLGQTGLQVSVLSFGASSLGGVFHTVDENEGIKTALEAVDSGINLIDVSPYYGLTKAESVLGKAIKQMNRDHIILSTKAGRYGENTFDFSPQRIKQSVDESLKRLNTDYIDILHLHDIEFVDDMNRIIEDSIPALEDLKQAGKIRFTGITGYPLHIFKLVLDQVRVDTIISYCHYSLNDTSLTDILPYLNKKNVGVINASPLSMGLLTSRGAPDWHPASVLIKQTCQKAAQYCEERGADLTKLAVQFSVQNEQVPTTLISTANLHNIRNNVKWVDEPIDEQLLAEVQQLLQPIMNESWPSGNPQFAKLQ